MQNIEDAMQELVSQCREDMVALIEAQVVLHEVRVSSEEMIVRLSGQKLTVLEGQALCTFHHIIKVVSKVDSPKKFNVREMLEQSEQPEPISL